MRPLYAFFVIGGLLGTVTLAQAVSLASIDIGDSYYVHQDLDDNMLVTVVAIDATARKIKVRYANGAVDWVTPGRLLSQSQNDADELASAAAIIQIFGCVLAPNDPSCTETEWKPGTPHPQYAHVSMGSDRGTWRPAPGYIWEEPNHFGPVVWSPGIRHPDYVEVVAAEKENSWIPLPGYQWKNPPNFGPVIWSPGLANRNSPHMVAGDTPKSWAPASGYKWANPSNPKDMTIVPK